jgi:hypothetical protein
MPTLHLRIWHLGIGFGILVLVAAALAGVWYLLFRSPSDAVGLRQALTIYRQGRDGTAKDLPSPGVYRYRTSGGEQLSLAGAARTFPGTSYLIVNDGGCATERWEPFEQHVEGVVVCPAAGGGFTATTATSYEEIAGTRTTSVITCPTGTAFLPAHPTAGQRWRAACQSSGSPVTIVGTVVGRTSVAVGGTTVPAVHTRITYTFAGSEVGTNPTDYWVSPATGLVLREAETVDLSQAAGPLGSVRYTERMAITLDSATPDR